MSEPEVWLRGPLPDIPLLLQPVVHSLLQCREEVDAVLPSLSTQELAQRPGGAASIAFHVRHCVGSLDRLLTYARGEQLSPDQLHALETESAPVHEAALDLVSSFDAAVDRAIEQVRATPVSTLTDSRKVGRAQLPSTVNGLLFHAAEHTQRHVGQLVTTAKLVAASRSQPHSS